MSTRSRNRHSPGSSKPRGRPLHGVAAALLLALSATATATARPAIWQDAMTGYAIGGYDPLAYYTQGEPRPGNDTYELAWGGAVWRFASSGNLDAFKRHPDVYAPRFAGYDPVMIAGGRTTPGQPAIWARDGDAVYLFHNAASRQAWLEDRDVLLAAAQREWPRLADTLPAWTGQ